MSSDRSVRIQSPASISLGREIIPRALKDFSIYVHVPFCTSRCRYCNFYFETGWSPRVLERTLDTILEESRAFAPHLLAEGGRVSTVYFGGGTPSVIPPATLDAFLAAFRAVWKLSPDSGLREFAFEANPESLGEELLQVFARHGVDRLSLGVQSFDSEALVLLGRRAVEADVVRALEIVREARARSIWGGRLNIDLITGVPGRSKAKVERDIRRVLSANPDHVSVYTLTIEEGTPLEQMITRDEALRPRAEDVEDEWTLVDGILEGAGYRNYEISNYARPGSESRHNLSYWNLRPYVGLGPGAVGTLPVSISESTGSQVLRMTNPDAFAYSRASRRSWEHAVELVSNFDFLFEHFITGLRTRDGVSLTDLERIFHLNRGTLNTGAFAALWATWEKSGHASAITDNRLALTRSGRFILNILLGDVLDALETLREGLDSDASPHWPL